MATYNYSIATAFPSGLNISQFCSEIIASELGPYYSEINSIDDDLGITFTISLDAGQLTILDTLMADHFALPPSTGESGTVLSDSLSRPISINSSVYFLAHSFLITRTIFETLRATAVYVTTTNSSTSFSARLYDSLNTITLAEINNKVLTANTKTLVSLKIINQPLPDTDGIFEMQIKINNAIGAVNYYGCTIQE